MHTCAGVFIILTLVGVGSWIRKSWSAKPLQTVTVQVGNGGTMEMTEPRPLWNTPERQSMPRETDIVTGLNWEQAGRLPFDKYLKIYGAKASLITIESYRDACSSYLFYRSWVNDTDAASFAPTRAQQLDALRGAISLWDETLLAYRDAQRGKSVQILTPGVELDALREETMGEIISLMRNWMPQRETRRNPALAEFESLQSLLIMPQLADPTANLPAVDKLSAQLTLVLKDVRVKALQLPDGSAKQVAKLLLDQYNGTEILFAPLSSVTNSATSAIIPPVIPHERGIN